MANKTQRTLLSSAMLFCIIIISFQVLFNQNSLAMAADPSRLKIYVGPPKVLADNAVYEAIFVQLQDSKGLPARASSDIVVHLSSSLTYVGSVDPSITIAAGSTYTIAKFYSTFTPGTTTITAAATGYASVQASLTTVGPVPSKLVVYVYPSTLPANGGSYDAVVVQLQDSAGVPAKAPIGNVPITLSCSDTAIGTVKSAVTISAGSTYVKTNFNTTTTTGTATITAISAGYTSGSATVRTQIVSMAPEKLKVYINPPKISAEGNAYDSVVVQLLDSTNVIAVSSTNVIVDLTSSDTAVGTVITPLLIPAGSNYAKANFHSTFMSGSATITAVATDYTSSQATITTVGPVPTKLGVYCVPSSLPADGKTYEAIIVQLQDAQGKPAKDPIGDINIDLFSSKPEIGETSSSIVIPYGKTFAIASFYSKYDTGATAVTAITPGYVSGTSNFAISLIDVYNLEVTVSANPDPASSGKDTTVRVYVTYSGLGVVPGATIKISSNKGGNFSAITDEKTGYYMAIFRAPIVTTATICTIRANATKTGYGGGQGTLALTINPSGDVGNANLIILDMDENPINGANVTSISQPAGALPLRGNTDENGVLAFTSILAGSYLLEVQKTGYETTNLKIDVSTNQTLNRTIYVEKIPPGLMETLLDPSTLIIIVGVIAALIVAVVVIIIVRRRWRNPDKD